MNIKRKNKNIFDVSESGSLSDLAFLLIIFFIVIAIFNINKGFLLGLPQKHSTKIVNVKDIIKITLSKDAELFYMGKVISIEELEKIINENLATNPNLTVLLKIDEEVKYQNVVNIVEVIRKLDVENFSFSILEK